MHAASSATFGSRRSPAATASLAVHERPVAGTRAVPRGPEDPSGHERSRACPTRCRRRKEESLREPFGAGHAGRGAVLLADRVGEAVRRRASRLPRRGGSESDPEPGHGTLPRDLK